MNEVTQEFDKIEPTTQNAIIELYIDKLKLPPTKHSELMRIFRLAKPLIVIGTKEEKRKYFRVKKESIMALGVLIRNYI